MTCSSYLGGGVVLCQQCSVALLRLLHLHPHFIRRFLSHLHLDGGAAIIGHYQVRCPSLAETPAVTQAVASMQRDHPRRASPARLAPGREQGTCARTRPRPRLSQATDTHTERHRSTGPRFHRPQSPRRDDTCACRSSIWEISSERCASHCLASSPVAPSSSIWLMRPRLKHSPYSVVAAQLQPSDTSTTHRKRQQVSARLGATPCHTPVMVAVAAGTAATPRWAHHFPA